MLYPKSNFFYCFICKNCLEFPVLLGHEVLFGLAGQSYPKSENNNVKNGAGRSRSEPVGASRSQTEPDGDSLVWMEPELKFEGGAAGFNQKGKTNLQNCQTSNKNLRKSFPFLCYI